MYKNIVNKIYLKINRVIINFMATLFKRNGIWYINYIDGNGNRVKRSLGVKDKKLAELKLKEIEIALAKRQPHKTNIFIFCPQRIVSLWLFLNRLFQGLLSLFQV